MKRISNVWKDAIDKTNAYLALVNGTKNKRTKRQVKRFLYSEEDVAKNKSLWHNIDPKKGKPYANMLANRLETKTWVHNPPRHQRKYCANRASCKGKWRDLYIPGLDDHIMHHMIMSASMEAFTRGMHPHCCGSIPGRGIKHVIKTVSNWLENDLECRYFVKLDIRKFFDNIDREILMSKLERKIKDKDILWAHRQIIYSAPVACPVGYYPSPWYANLYLEELDWFIEQQLFKTRRGKRIKYARHSLRYVDDILLIGTSKSDLDKAVRAIQRYLDENYDLSIKPTWEIKKIGKHEFVDGKWRLRPGTYWCDIGGYKFCKDATVLRDGIFLSTQRLAKKMYKQGYYTDHQCRSINAKVAWAEHCDSLYFLRDRINPYVDINTTRRLISNVDKERKRRACKTTGN